MRDKFQRYRERQRRGISVVPVEVSQEDLWALIDAGHLDINESEDREAVAVAMKKSLRVACNNGKTA